MCPARPVQRGTSLKAASGCTPRSDLPQFITAAIIRVKVHKQTSVVQFYHTFTPCYLTGDFKPFWGFPSWERARRRGSVCSAADLAAARCTNAVRAPCTLTAPPRLPSRSKITSWPAQIASGVRLARGMFELGRICSKHLLNLLFAQWWEKVRLGESLSLKYKPLLCQLRNPSSHTCFGTGSRARRHNEVPQSGFLPEARPNQARICSPGWGAGTKPAVLGRSPLRTCSSHLHHLLPPLLQGRGEQPHLSRASSDASILRALPSPGPLHPDSTTERPQRAKCQTDP